MFRPFACENLSSGTTFPIMATGCLRKVVKLINILRQRVRANYSSGTNALDKATACLIKLLKWNNFSSGTAPLRNLICLFCLFSSQPTTKETPI